MFISATADVTIRFWYRIQVQAPWINSVDRQHTIKKTNGIRISELRNSTLLCCNGLQLLPYTVWKGSFLMYLSRSALPCGSTSDSCEKPSSSTKQISNSFGSDRIITRTVALPGVANVMSGVKIVCLLSIINWLISVWISYGTENAMRPNAFLR